MLGKWSGLQVFALSIMLIMVNILYWSEILNHREKSVE